MIIRQYAGLPTTYAPDIGEVLLARRTPVDKFVRAVVLHARRNRAGNLRIKVQWLDDDPDAGIEDYNQPKKPIKSGDQGVIVVSTNPLDPRLIKQIDRGSAASR